MMPTKAKPKAKQDDTVEVELRLPGPLLANLINIANLAGVTPAVALNVILAAAMVKPQ